MRIIFKHSSTCPVSARAYREFQKFDTQLPVELVIVQNDRQRSNEIATQYGIKHESPQVLFVAGDKVLAHASHGSITFDWLQKQEKELGNKYDND